MFCRAAASSLGKIGDSESIIALKREIQQGSSGMVRAFSLRGLSELKDPRLVPFFLEQALRTESRSLVRGQERVTGISDRYRRLAIEAIAETGDADAIGPLEEILRSPDSNQSLQESAKRAINKLAGETIYDIR